MSTLAHEEYRPFPTLELKNVLQQQLEVPALTRLLDLPTGGRVLEVGCGAGVALAPLARLLRPARLEALEIDPSLAGQARARGIEFGLDVAVTLGDVREMPYPDNSFDLVIDFGTCYHIARPELALAEIARVLDGGGIFVHETPLSQLMAHPIRSWNRALPWSTAPGLEPTTTALFWSARRAK